jgi:hypothetical protein
MVGLALAIASVGIAGCHDMLPVSPVPTTAQDPSLSTYPTEEQLAELPPEFRTAPSILGYWTKTGFVGSQAWARAWMQYWANYAKVSVELSLLYNNAHVTTTTGYSEQASVLPAVRELEAFTSLGVSGSCGHTVNATGIFYVHHQAPVGKGWFVFGEEKRSESASAAQPPCSCTSTLQIQTADYDPYSKDQGDCESGTGDSSGSGTQYQPGDYTGGETVSWSTGIGNGGSSLCGSDAVVEFICIDYWDAATGKWVEWSCGFATTCGYAT